MNFARTIKMLILSATFMGGAVLTPMLTTPAQAQADLADVIVSAGPGGGPHVKVYDGNSFDPGFTGGIYVAASDVSDEREEEGNVEEEEEVSAASIGQPEYKYIPVRR